MGRLFWKFFFFIWLAQLTAIFGIALYVGWERSQIEARVAQRFAELGLPVPEGAPFGPRRGGPGAGPQGPPSWMHPPPDHLHGPPPEHLRGYRPPLLRGPGPYWGGLPVVPLAAGLLASLVFAALLARHFSRPIRSLSQAFEAAAGGDLSVRVGAAMGARSDELADLGRGFDRMTARLEALLDGQRRLLHDVSHELRSPLARLQAAIGLARQQPARQDAALARIETESGRMDHLVGELLTLARLEAGMTPPRMEAVDVSELLGAIVEDARFEAGIAGATTEEEGAPARVALHLDASEGLMVNGDAELLHRAIENVVRNALKFTAPGSCVEVLARAAEGAVEIVVEDHGPGVPENDLARIFEPFYRSEGARNATGHGLGLAIATYVATAHGGSIAARNRAEGGLAVTLCLPGVL